MVLYRAFDLCCLEMATRCDIPAGWETPPDNIPDSAIDFWRQKRAEYGLLPKAVNAPIHIGLTDRIFLLAGLKVIPSSDASLRSILSALDIRNTCWLAHGDRTVLPEQWEYMKRILIPLIMLI